MTVVPMLADFVIRLAFGLSITSLMISWRAVPLPFFRTQTQVILGLLVLGALDQARSARSDPRLSGLVVTSAILAYISAVAWGLGLPKIGTLDAGTGRSDHGGLAHRRVVFERIGIMGAQRQRAGPPQDGFWVLPSRPCCWGIII